MRVSALMKIVACLAVIGFVSVMATSQSMAQQSGAYGQLKKGDQNGNGNGNANGLNNPNSNRSENCRGRQCGTPEITETVDVTDIEDGVEIIDCMLPQFKDDPLCEVPSKKKAKRKVVSVKLSQEELAVAPAAPAVETTPIVVAPAPAPAPAPIAKAKPVSSVVEPNDVGSINFQ